MLGIFRVFWHVLACFRHVLARICVGDVSELIEDCRVCLGHVVGSFGHVLGMIWICFRYVLGMFRTFVRHVLGMFHTRVPAYVRYVFGICSHMGFTLVWANISLHMLWVKHASLVIMHHATAQSWTDFSRVRLHTFRSAYFSSSAINVGLRHPLRSLSKVRRYSSA